MISGTSRSFLPLLPKTLLHLLRKPNYLLCQSGHRAQLYHLTALSLLLSDLIKQLTEAKPEDSVSLSEKDKGRMMEEAQRIMQEMRKRGCTAQRDKAGSKQEKAHKC